MAKSDGHVIIEVNLNASEAEKDLAKMKRKIQSTEKEIEDLSKKRNEAQKKSLFNAGELDKEKAKLQEIKDRISEIRAKSKDKGISLDERTAYKNQIPILQQELADQKTRVSMLQSEWNKTENSVERYSNRIAEATAKLEQQKNEAGELVRQIDSAKNKGTGIGEVIDGAGNAMGKLTDRAKKLASSVFVFTVIASALGAIRSWIAKLIKTNDEARASLSQLKGALLTLVQPIVEVVIPAIIKLINILTKVVYFAANIVSRLFGKTVKQSSDAAKSLNEQAEAYGGVGDSASEASKSIAGFDEINTLSSGNESSGGSGGYSDAVEPDFSGSIGEKLGEVEAIVGGALLALGAILAFSGTNIPLGITLMALGALTLAAVVKENWDAIVQAIQGPIGAITAIVSIALLAIGAILTFSGAHIGLGIGLMIVGAAGLAATVAINWDKITKFITDNIATITTVISGALLAIGAILTLTGAHIALGVGLMILGAAGLATTAVINWDTIKEKLQGQTAKIVAIVSTALLALGALLTFTGAAIPLGIALMVAGAAGLAATAAVNWNSIVQALQGPIGAVVAIVSVALLALGVILLFTGVGIPLGLGLIVAGAAGLAVAIAPNWGFIKEKIQGAWNSVKEFWNKHIAKYFTADFWKQLGKDMLNGLLGSIENGLNTALSGAGSFVNGIIGVLNKIPGVSIGEVNWGNVQLPRLAQGAVIPPNREFMAVLGDQKRGTNIEAPLETIQEAVALVMDDYIASNTAGQEAMVMVLRDILQAVLGIQIGDSVIGEAVARYQQKMAVVKGY